MQILPEMKGPTVLQPPTSKIRDTHLSPSMGLKGPILAAVSSEGLYLCASILCINTRATTNNNNINNSWCYCLPAHAVVQETHPSKDATCKKRWTRAGYSLCVAGGPRQPLGLLHDDDRSRRVIRRALHLVRGQSQELRSAVRVFQR